MTPHDLAEGVPRQGTFELEKRMRMIYIDRNRFALFGCLWAKPRRTMAVFFHEVLLRGNTCAYPQTEQKEQRLFNPRRARCAPWVGSTDRGPLSPLRDLLYVVASCYPGPAPHMVTCSIRTAPVMRAGCSLTPYKPRSWPKCLPGIPTLVRR